MYKHHLLSSQTSHVYYQAARVVCLYPQFRSRDISQFFKIFSPHVKDPRRSWILDSTPWIPDSRYKITDLFQWNLDSRFQLSVGLRIPTAVLWIPRSRIPDSTCKNFPDSGIRILLHGAKFPLYSHPKTCKIYEKTKKNYTFYKESTAWLRGLFRVNKSSKVHGDRQREAE